MENTKYEKSGSIILIPCNEIDNSEFAYRDEKNDNDLLSLAASIKINGIISPLNVRKVDDKFQLICGHRRLSAARLIGLKKVPCIIMAADDLSCALYTLSQNEHFRDRKCTEKALLLQKILKKFTITQKELAFRLGKSQSYISNLIRLLDLGEEICTIISDNNLSERHARALLKLPDYSTRKLTLDYILRRNLTVEQTEKYIDALLMPKLVAKRPPQFKKLKDIRIFVNTINHAVDTMRSIGIDAVSHGYETDDYIEYVVRIPKTVNSPVSFATYSDNAV